MGAPAEVFPVALPVNGDLFARGDAGDDLGLVFLAESTEVFHRIVPLHDLPADRHVRLRELFHTAFDGFEIFRRERPLEGEVVVEAVLDHGSDGDLGLGIEILDRLGQEVGRGMTDDLDALLVPRGHDGHLRVAIDHEIRVDEPVVHPTGHRGFGEARPDVGCHVGHRDRLIEPAFASVR
mgnify:CR=1 FL=1